LLERPVGRSINPKKNDTTMTPNTAAYKTLTRSGKATTTNADGTVTTSGPVAVILHADRVQLNASEHRIDECKIGPRSVTVGSTVVAW